MTGCDYCAGEPEPGYVEMPNNGPVGPCPVCNPKSDREIEYDRALMQRRIQNAASSRTA